MAAIGPNDVINHYPAFADVSDGVQVDVCDYVNTHVNVAKFGGENAIKTKMARIALAAHLGEVRRRSEGGGQTGDVRSESISATALTVTYAEASSSGLRETSAGRDYLALARRSAARVGHVPD